MAGLLVEHRIRSSKKPQAFPKKISALQAKGADHPCRTAKGPYTSHVRTVVPKTIPGMVFAATVLKWAVYGPFGNRFLQVGMRSTTLSLQQPALLG